MGAAVPRPARREELGAEAWLAAIGRPILAGAAARALGAISATRVNATRTADRAGPGVATASSTEITIGATGSSGDHVAASAVARGVAFSTRLPAVAKWMGSITPYWDGRGGVGQGAARKAGRRRRPGTGATGDRWGNSYCIGGIFGRVALLPLALPTRTQGEISLVGRQVQFLDEDAPKLEEGGTPFPILAIAVML